MAQRLSYQTWPAGASFSENPRALTQRTAGQLSQMEDLMEGLEGSSWLRIQSLKRLHEDSVTTFINSPGFGIARRFEPRKEYIDLPDIEPISLPGVATNAPRNDAGMTRIVPSPVDSFARTPAEENLRELHRDSVVDFVNKKGFGLIDDKGHVTGFQAHHFHAVPQLKEGPGQTQRWRIQSLELVSLLKQDEPGVYLSKNLPRMDELREAPTRPLHPFETSALPALKGGEDLQVDTTADRIRLLGSIRAIKQCLTCHEGQRGDLLGAFSYCLVRERTQP
jgi:hypothetical protein